MTSSHLTGKNYKEASKQLLIYLREKDVFLNTLLESEQMNIVIWTLNGTVVWFNQYARLMTGYTEEDLNKGIKVKEIIPEEIVCHIQEAARKTEDTTLRYECTCPFVSGDGKELYITWHNCLLQDDDCKKYIVSTGIDVTDFRNATKQLEDVNKSLFASNEELSAQQEELSAMNEELMAQDEGLRNSLADLQRHQEMLRKSEERYRLVVEGAKDGLWDWDITTDSVYISQWWNNIIKFEKQEMKNHYRNWLKVIHPKDIKRVQKDLEDYLKRKIPYYSCEYRIKLANGKYIWILSKGKALWDRTGQAVRMAGSHTDITERKKNENELKRLAYYDLLTGVLTRTTFMDRLKTSLREARKNGLKLAVLFLDIDNFKTINDAYGHYIGDRVLKKIAGRLKSCIQSQDTLYRMGGDEFAIVVPGFLNIKDIDHLAQRLIEVFNQPLVIGSHNLYSTISIGIAVYPDHGRDGKNLIKKADKAMYEAKESGKNNLRYFHDISRDISSDSHIIKDLRNALKNGELFLCYQPIVDVKGKKAVCLEALLRWKHPKKGIISPLEFIPVAEKTRLIIPLGEWVLRTACRQLKEWHEMGYSGYGVSINVSVIQLQQPDFAEVVSKILAEAGVSPHFIELEITESALMESTHTVEINLIHLRKQGVKVAIDDFGTGYNSLKYLQEFVVNSLKIDRIFTSNIRSDVNRVIIDTVILLGHKISAEIIAEGVETIEQYEYLKMKGCDKIQGYYFSKPLLPSETLEFLKRHPG